LDFKSAGHRLVFEELEVFMEPDDIVLDVGCGDGSFLERIVSDFGVEGMGIDPSASIGESSETECNRLRAENVDELEKDFDIVYSINSLHHFGDVEAFFKNVDANLKPEGKIIIADWKEGASTGIPESYYSGEYIESVLTKSGSKMIKSREFEKQFFLVAGSELN
jgi:cyclopropane fatty-acyl-phospholipid synthase-like methyltransferase